MLANGPDSQALLTPSRGVSSDGICPERTKTEVYVHRWQHGDDLAFECIARRYYPLLIRRVQRAPAWPALRARYSAEDIVQEIWIHVVRYSKRSFESQGAHSFCALVATITDRQIKNLSRGMLAQKRGDGVQEMRTSEMDEERAGSRPGKSFPPTASSVARVSELCALAEEVLSPDEHEVWTLVDGKQFNSQEAGLAMGRSDASIRGLLKRGRLKLISRLQKSS